jgi:hypothetical protein
MVKAKGFSLGKGDDAIKRFDMLVSGREIEVERMIRLRENLKKGCSIPAEVIIKKRLSENVIPKRYTYPDSQTRPWHIGELQTLL